MKMLHKFLLAEREDILALCTEKLLALRELRSSSTAIELGLPIFYAVTEFRRSQQEENSQEDLQRLGFLAHELRNALGNAAMAHQMIKPGIVGVGGSTNKVLENSLTLMKNIIDRSLSEVPMRGELTLDRRRYRVIDMVGEVEAAALFDAKVKSIHLHIDMRPEFEIIADRHLVVSAISNLVQNAIKLTKPEGNVWIRGTATNEQVLITVEDECGGLPPGKIEELFRPFVQKGDDKTGVGLGLSITRRAIGMNDGEISVTNFPERGCIFTIALPRANDMTSDAIDHTTSSTSLWDITYYNQK